MNSPLVISGPQPHIFFFFFFFGDQIASVMFEKFCVHFTEMLVFIQMQFLVGEWRPFIIHIQVFFFVFLFVFRSALIKNVRMTSIFYRFVCMSNCHSVRSIVVEAWSIFIYKLQGGHILDSFESFFVWPFVCGTRLVVRAF